MIISKTKIYTIIVLLVMFTAIAGCGGNSLDPVAHATSTPTGAPTGTKTPEPPPSIKPVIFVSGGTTDDSVSYLLLSTMENVDLLGVIITNTDCIASYSIQTQWRIESYVNDIDTPVALSDSRGWNPFPWLYRKDSIEQSNISILSDYSNNPEWPPFPSGESLLAESLARAVETNRPVTILNTCPITMLRNVLEQNPYLENGIESVIMMGGAIDVPGNLDPGTIPEEIANPLAEWNIFNDPYSFDWILKNTSFPLVLFGLDVTDEVPVSEEFLSALKSQSETFRYSELVYENYALISDEPFFRMWNSVTTSYISRPDLFSEPEITYISVDTEGYNQGAILRDGGGRPVFVVFDMADKEGFYSYVLDQFKKNYVNQ